MNKFIGCILLFACVACFATENLHPVAAPTTYLGIQGTVELDEDVYSGDMEVSAEYAVHPRHERFGMFYLTVVLYDLIKSHLTKIVCFRLGLAEPITFRFYHVYNWRQRHSCCHKSCQHNRSGVPPIGCKNCDRNRQT